MELVKGETLQTAMPTMSRAEKREVPVRSTPRRILHHRAEHVLLEISLLYYYFWRVKYIVAPVEPGAMSR